jgi:hypothetical protein
MFQILKRAASEHYKPAFAATRLRRDSLRVKTTRWLAEPKLAAGERRLVSQTFASWNRVVGWLRQLKAIRVAV